MEGSPNAQPPPLPQHDESRRLAFDHAVVRDGWAERDFLAHGSHLAANGTANGPAD
jgi:hypothetical protein